jgi:hypothetical protein
VRRATISPNQHLTTIAEQAAADLAERFARAGVSVDMPTYTDFGPLLTTAFSALVAARDETESEAAAMRARRDGWVADHGLLTWQEAGEHLGLSSKELHAAVELGFVRSVPVPTAMSGHAFAPEHLWVVRALSLAERRQIAETTLLTRLQAAKHLGISPAAFDRRRTQLGIRPAATLRGESGWPAYQYRLADLEHMRAMLHAAGVPTQGT